MTVHAFRLNHAVLFVASLERSVSFYSAAFGMTVMAREPRANASRRMGSTDPAAPLVVPVAWARIR